MKARGTVLEKILNKKFAEVQRLRQEKDLEEMRRQVRDCPPALDFAAALRNAPHAAVIAEIKKASPSAGQLKASVDPAALAGEYKAGGAAALSILTDRPFFGGCLDDLACVRKAVDLPLLRKDFIVDPLQVYEARLAGADAVLLIVAALEEETLAGLFTLSVSLGLTPLVEVHNEEELGTALKIKAPVIGINNRNLKTLEVSLETCLGLRPMIGDGVLTVAESGINTRGDLEALKEAGFDAFLIGTALMRSNDPRAALAGLCGAGA